MTKWRFQWKHAHIFLFFVDGIQWNSDEKWRYSRIFGDKNLKTCGGIHWNRGFLVDLRPSASTPPKNPRFQWNHHRFQVLIPKNTWNRHFSSEFHWNRQQKKGRFPLKTVILANFGHTTTIFWQKFQIFH